MKDYDYLQDEFATLERALHPQNLEAFQDENLEYASKYVVNGLEKALEMLNNPFATKVEKMRILSAVYHTAFYDGGLEG
jgi:hypothetical protein